MWVHQGIQSLAASYRYMNHTIIIKQTIAVTIFHAFKLLKEFLKYPFYEAEKNETREVQTK